MSKLFKIILIILSILIAAVLTSLAIYFVFFNNKNEISNQTFQQNLNIINPDTNTNSEPQSQFTYPIQNFKTNQTKKTFDQFITAENSPIQPERFSGYHAGADIEINPDQIDQDVPIYAIEDAQVVYLGYVSGYGGVIILQGNVNNQPVTFLYGHIKLSSVNLSVGDQVSNGQQIGILGDQYSTETDRERKHLHFAIHKGSNIELRGYVNNEAELQNWYNPNDIIK
ncbi:MAG: M23 family metallopeptidase [Patescibacteria group bacterium]|jgi:murein DD-endopeptidase MepM/ murein hydrolase activator NlpD